MKVTKNSVLIATTCFIAAAWLVSSCGTSDKTNSPIGGGVCGNAIVEYPEECDDGNNNDNDDCLNVCIKNNASASSSIASSGGGTCGNGKVDQGESCDDGNDDDNDSCHNNCTSNAPKDCGNGKVDVGEECDDGNNVADDTCSNLCQKPFCGDGIVQANEDCDDGKNNGEFGSNCPDDCKNPNPAATSSSSVDPCEGQKIFFAAVSNNQNPNIMGAGIQSKWSYSGLEGLQAGDAMCQSIGADHVCKYSEIVAAEANGELSALPSNLTYWLHRTTPVPNPLLNNKTCNIDLDCTASNSLPYCDPVAKICSYKPGAGGRCNDWTYPTGHISDGEWVETFKNGNSKNNGGVKIGNLVYHFDGDTFYDGVSQAHLCKSETTLGCSGACAGATRAILCCNSVCK